MRYLLIACALLGFARTSDAQSLRTATETFAIAATADWMSTRSLIARGGVEKNPMFRWVDHNPDAVVALGASADILGVWAWNRTVGKKHPKIAAAGLYVAAGARVWLTVRNMRTQRNTPTVPWGGFAPQHQRTSHSFYPGRS